MENFVARQPIFDIHQKVYAYELLFRSGLENYFGAVDGDQATSQVIVNSFLLFGIEELTSGAKAFINFTKSTLVKEYALILPREYLVIEVLENVEPDEEILGVCRKLKEGGFLLALDDFVYAPKYQPLLDLADIVKVDFLISDQDERTRLAATLIPRGIKLLAEKVETVDEFQEAVRLGYSFFQGYFFSKPVIVSRKDIPGYKLNLLRLLKEANQPDIDFDILTDMIQSELTISFKLLKLVNSSAYSPRSKITTIKHALTYMGENDFRKWASLLTLTGIADDKPAELVVSSLVRAKFAEALAELSNQAHRASDFFLMGLFSQLDAIVGRPLKEILAEIPLADDVAEAILGQGGLKNFFKLVVAFEKGQWSALPGLAAALGLDEARIPQAYYQALQWPQQLLAVF